MKTYRVKHTSGSNKNKFEYSFIEATSKEEAFNLFLHSATWLSKKDIFEIVKS